MPVRPLARIVAKPAKRGTRAKQPIVLFSWRLRVLAANLYLHIAQPSESERALYIRLTRPNCAHNDVAVRAGGWGKPSAHKA